MDDIAKANIVSMKSKIKEGFFNIGTGIGTTINHLAEILIEISGEDITSVHSEELEGDIKFSQADTSLTEQVFGWKFQTVLNEGLRKIYSDF